MDDYSAVVVELEVFPHDNADRLEIAQPVGTDWFVVVGKEQFKTGDLGVFVPIGTVASPEFIKKHLEKSKIQLNKGRIKTVKIRGVYSQGIIVTPDDDMQLGEDVTKKLGITKYEPPARSEVCVSTKGSRQYRKVNKYRREVDALFPVYTKIRNFKHFPLHINTKEKVVITEKIHGTNFRAGKIYVGHTKQAWWRRLFRCKKQWEYVVGSHNVTKWVEDKLYHRAAKQYGLDKLGEEWDGFIFYGEVYGHGVQELSYGVPPGEIRLCIIDIMFKDKYGSRHYLGHKQTSEICNILRLPMAPVLYVGEWDSSLVRLADGASTISGADNIREGFVIKPLLVERYQHQVGRVVLKRISDAYLTSKKRTEYH
jgi:RNA ligase (TIGR02306 family)